MAATLEFHSVSKEFRKRGKTIRALKEVSFDVAEGEVFGFVGPNGAGKSTTIKSMLDVINDYTGEIRIYGIPAHEARSRQGVAYLPESPALYEQFTPLEILRMALRMYNIKRKDENDWCMQWLERFSVAQNAKRKIRHLSKGNVQRVALAHALVVQPKLLVLDEPLSGLDPVGRRDVIDILQDYKDSGGSIFFTSHVLHDVERIADRFGFINEGELVTTRDPRDLVSTDDTRMIIRYQSTDPQLSVGAQLRSDEFEHELEQHEVPEFITRINQVGGRLVSIKPAISLESVFFQTLKSEKDKQQ